MSGWKSVAHRAGCGLIVIIAILAMHRVISPARLAQPVRLLAGTIWTAPNWVWRTDNSLLQPSELSESPSSLIWDELHLNTGARARLPQLRGMSMWGVLVSPDSRWALDYGAGNASRTAVVYSLENNSRVSWTSSNRNSWFENAAWLDSTHWMAVENRLDSNTHLITFDVNSRTPISNIRLPHLDQRLPDPFSSPVALMGRTQQGSILAIDSIASGYFAGEAWNSSSVLLTELTPSNDSFSARQYFIRARPYERFVDLALSPTGDRLVCLIWTTRAPSAWMLKLGQWFPSLKPDSGNYFEIRICNLDGTGMRVVYKHLAENQTSQRHSNYDFQLPQSLRWLPGGKAISYCLRTPHDGIELYKLTID